MAINLPVVEPPSDAPESLRRYLVALVNGIDTIYGNVGKLPVTKLMPPKPIVGKLYYFEDEIPQTDITQEGLYVYKSSGWTFIV